MRGVKTRNEDRWKRAAVFVALLLVLIFLLNSVTKVYKKKKSAEETLVRMEKEKKELEERSKNLEETLLRLETKEGLDYEIRKRFNVAGAGEGVAIIVEEEGGAPIQNTEKSSWQKIKDFFTDLF